MLGDLISIRKKSAWAFVTSGTGGLGIGFFAGSGGEVVLSPPSGPPKGFYYGAAGVGVSAGLKRIPKIGRILDPHGVTERGAAVGAPKQFWNHGIVYVMDGCQDDDLTAEDFHGVCCTIDIGAGLLIGYSGSGLLINVNPLALIDSVNPILSMVGPSLRPKVMVLSRGWNAGLQASVGASASIGYMWPKSGAA